MRIQLSDDLKVNGIKLLALANLLLGLVFLLFPEFGPALLGQSADLNKILIETCGVYIFTSGIGQFIVSFDSPRHYGIILTQTFFYFFISPLIVLVFFNQLMALKSFIIVISYLIINIIIFFYILVDAYEQNIKEESAPKKFHDLIKYVRTNQGQSLLEMSQETSVLLIFIRHFGCTFCRETVSEIAKLEEKIKGKNLTPVFVHMSDPDSADEFFSRYYSDKVQHVSDPTRSLYKGLGLKRGSLMQLLGPKVVVDGFWAGLTKGHFPGAIEGDFLQLGGYFVLSKGQIVFEHKARGASDNNVFDLLPQK